MQDITAQIKLRLFNGLNDRNITEIESEMQFYE